MEEESRANSYIVKERLPKDLESRKKTVIDLQRVVAEPAMGQGDLDELNNKVATVVSRYILPTYKNLQQTTLKTLRQNYKTSL